MARGRKTGGRTKGSANRMTRDVKSAIEGAFHDAGGRNYLATVAKDNPAVFCTLLGKILPKEITGAGGGPLTVQVLQFADHSNPSPLAPQALPAPAVELPRTGRQEV